MAIRNKAGIYGFALLSILLIAASPTLAAPQAAEGPMKLFKSQAGKFSVLMPGKPTMRSSQLSTSVGPINFHVFIVEFKNGTYMVGYNDYPSDSTGSAQSRLEGARDGALKNSKSTLLTDVPINLNGVPGRARGSGMTYDFSFP